MQAVRVSKHSAREGQEVRLLSYPGVCHEKAAFLSVVWGRVHHDGTDVLIHLLSDSGSSGGPVLDRAGDLLGLLARSHDMVRMSCMQKLRDLPELVRQKALGATQTDIQ